VSEFSGILDQVCGFFVLAVVFKEQQVVSCLFQVATSREEESSSGFFCLEGFIQDKFNGRFLEVQGYRQRFVNDKVAAGGYQQVKVLEFFDCPGPRQGVEDLRELLHKGVICDPIGPGIQNTTWRAIPASRLRVKSH
ncbi:hypothetical protein Tco_0641578, partial [Tanacetum coccineum]